MSLSVGEISQIVVELAAQECLIIRKKDRTNPSLTCENRRNSVDNVESHPTRRNAIKRKEPVFSVEFFLKTDPTAAKRLWYLSEEIDRITEIYVGGASSRWTPEDLKYFLQTNWDLRNDVLYSIRRSFPEIICIKRTEL